VPRRAASACSAQRDDRQISLALVECDSDFQSGTGLSSHLGWRRGAAGSGWPTRARFESRPAAGGRDALVSLQRCPAGKIRVRPEAIVPVGVCGHVPSHGRLLHRNDAGAEAFFLHRADESLDHGDAAVLTDGAESRLDLAPPAPTFEWPAPELFALVADNVPR